MLTGLIQRTGNPVRKEKYEAELECPPFPSVLSHLWKSFQRLSNRRGSNGFTSNPISFSEIEAFIRLSGTSLTPWEIEVIEMLDVIYRNEQARAGTELE